jgi:Ca2+-binding EF-hand superfamily protein
MLRNLDGNTDGKITSQEITVARDKLVAQHVDAMIKEIDSNNDGKVTKEEAQGTRIEQSFVRCDANSDGSITKDELKKSLTPEGRTTSQDGKSGTGQNP